MMDPGVPGADPVVLTVVAEAALVPQALPAVTETLPPEDPKSMMTEVVP